MASSDLLTFHLASGLIGTLFRDEPGLAFKLVFIKADKQIVNGHKSDQRQ